MNRGRSLQNAGPMALRFSGRSSTSVATPSSTVHDEHLRASVLRSPWQPPRSRRAYDAAAVRPGGAGTLAGPRRRRRPPPVTRLTRRDAQLRRAALAHRATGGRACGVRVRRAARRRRRRLALRAARPAEARRARARRRAVGPGGRDRDRGPEPLGGGRGRGGQGRLERREPPRQRAHRPLGPPSRGAGSAGRRRRRVRLAQPRPHPGPVVVDVEASTTVDAPLVLLVACPEGASFPRVLCASRPARGADDHRARDRSRRRARLRRGGVPRGRRCEPRGLHGAVPVDGSVVRREDPGKPRSGSALQPGGRRAGRTLRPPARRRGPRGRGGHERAAHRARRVRRPGPRPAHDAGARGAPDHVAAALEGGGRGPRRVDLQRTDRHAPRGAAGRREPGEHQPRAVRRRVRRHRAEPRHRGERRAVFARVVRRTGRRRAALVPRVARRGPRRRGPADPGGVLRRGRAAHGRRGAVGGPARGAVEDRRERGRRGPAGPSDEHPRRLRAAWRSTRRCRCRRRRAASTSSSCGAARRSTASRTSAATSTSR